MYSLGMRLHVYMHSDPPYIYTTHIPTPLMYHKNTHTNTSTRKPTSRIKWTCTYTHHSNSNTHNFKSLVNHNRSLTKECPWAEHLTKPVKQGSGHSFMCFCINHKGVPMYAYSDSLPTNPPKHWTNNNEQTELWALKLTLWQHATLWTEWWS